MVTAAQSCLSVKPSCVSKTTIVTADYVTLVRAFRHEIALIAPNVSTTRFAACRDSAYWLASRMTIVQEANVASTADALTRWHVVRAANVPAANVSIRSVFAPVTIAQRPMRLMDTAVTTPLVMMVGANRAVRLTSIVKRDNACSARVLTTSTRPFFWTSFVVLSR